MNKSKIPEKYKYGFRFIGPKSAWKYLWLFRYPRWILRPICWLKKHEYHIYYPYGIKVKECDRCGHKEYIKKTNEKLPKFNGEIGQLYNVRFITSKRSKSHEMPQL